MENEREELFICKPDPQDSGVYRCRKSPPSDKVEVGREYQKESTLTENPDTPVATLPQSPIETWTRVVSGQQGSETLKVRKISMDGKALYEVIKPDEVSEPKAPETPLKETQTKPAGMKTRLSNVNGCIIRQSVVSRRATLQQAKSTPRKDTEGEAG
ncbi:hypothetical protein [uncultured Methanoregula sp.]|uniref:hypothetical protein n=1 Tax=uncultured Methanoregula sp. TaxID=1005933 RepID=UPI002AAC2171|nr:hypothetical protein [uncultured Methanoregula sp.]